MYVCMYVCMYCGDFLLLFSLNTLIVYFGWIVIMCMVLLFVCMYVFVEKPLCEAQHGRHAGTQSREALLAALLKCHAGRSNYGVG